MDHLLGRTSRLVLGAWAGAIVLFGLIPLMVQVPLAFSNSKFLVFPPPGLGLNQFRAVAGNENWINSAWTSFRVAAIATLFATIAGTMAALGARRLPKSFTGVLRVLVITPLLVPVIVLAIAILNAYGSFRLIGNSGALAVAHSVLGLPLVFLMVSSGLSRVPKSYTEASASLGASPFRTALGVTLPIIAPSILTGALLAFVTSWDEVVVAIFVGGVRAMTLPRYMFGFLRTELSPEISAVSLLVVVLSIGLFSAYTKLTRRSGSLR